MAIVDAAILQVPNPRLPDDAYWETTILRQTAHTITSSGCLERPQAPKLHPGIFQ